MHTHIPACTYHSTHVGGQRTTFRGQCSPLTVSSRNQTWSSGLRSFYPLRPPVSPDISVSIPTRVAPYSYTYSSACTSHTSEGLSSPGSRSVSTSSSSLLTLSVSELTLARARHSVAPCRFTQWPMWIFDICFPSNSLKHYGFFHDAKNMFKTDTELDTMKDPRPTLTESEYKAEESELT